MASQDFLISRFYAAEEVMGRVVDDTPVVYRIKHVGTGTTQAPTVVVSNTSSTLTLTDGAAAATAIDFSAAATNTVGEVVDYINGLDSWECKLLDGLRTDASDNMVLNGSVTSAVVEGETVFDVLQDTSAMAKYRYRVTYDRGVNNNKPSGSHRVVLKKFTYYADLTAAANIVKIYKWNKEDKTETTIWSGAGVDTTETSHDLGNGITAGENNDLIVEIAGTVVDHASGFLQCQYKRE